MANLAFTPYDIFTMLLESQYWSKDQMLAYQHSQLGQFVSHARSSVPFYKDRMNCLFRTDGMIDWSRWHEVPVLTRKDVADNFWPLQSNAVPESHGSMNMNSTSGSTGIPLKVRSTFLWHTIHSATDWRAHTWWGLDCSRNLISVGEAKPRKKHEIDAPWGPALEPPQKNGIWYFEDALKPLSERISERHHAAAPYLYGQCSTVYSDALAAQWLGVTAEVAGVICSGESAEPEFRQAIRKTMKAEMHMLYSSKESGRMAYTCGARNHYHINAENVLVEILDKDNNPCKLGVEGRVVVTPFMNSAMPLIRYDQGDIAAFGPPCDCGRQLPVLEAPKGRTIHFFSDNNGNLFSPKVGDSYRLKLGAEFWQFVQTAKNEVTIRYKPEGAFDEERQSAFTEIVTKLFPRKFDFRYELIDTLPLTAAGKFIKFINRTQDRRPDVDPWNSNQSEGNL